MVFETLLFSSLFDVPQCNGIYKSKEYMGRGVKLVKMKELFGNERISAQKGIFELIELSDKEKKRLLLQNDDLLFSRTSVKREGVGKCSIIYVGANELTFDSNIIRIRFDSRKAYAPYYFFYFSSLQGRDHVRSLASGVAVTTVTGTGIAGLEIPCPPLPTQHKIASILSAYDDLIENNTRRIQILEEMAQALYRKWFVEFRFPGHEKVKMVESELGMVPEGWEVVSFSETVHINPKTPASKGVEKPYVSMSGLSTDSMLIDEFEMRMGNSGSKFKNNDTLMARITPSIENGKTGFVQFLLSDNDVAIGSTEFIVFRSKNLNPYYVYLLARTEDFRQHGIKSMTGASGRQRIQVQCFNEYNLPQPSKDILIKFASIVAPMFQITHSLFNKNRNLRSTRDLLLPKLISGEVDVSSLDIPTGELT